MLFKAMPAEVMAAWSHAAIPDLDFQELSMTGAGPTWSIPREGDAQPTVRLRPVLRVRQPPSAAAGCCGRAARRVRARALACARYGRVSDAGAVVGLRANVSLCRLQVDHDGSHKANQQRSEVRHRGAGSRSLAR